MTDWSAEQLDAIERAEELAVLTARADGTFRRPVPIWVVRVGSRISVRSYRGEAAAWYRRARADRAGRIRAAGFKQAVLFDPVTRPGRLRGHRCRVHGEVRALQRQLCQTDGREACPDRNTAAHAARQLTT